MKDNRTHRAMTHAMFPWLPSATIDNVNHAMDHPTPMQLMLNKQRIASNKKGSNETSMGNRQNWTPITYRKGHRAMNHDLVSAGMLGYVRGGPQGILAAWGHIMEDAVSDGMTTSKGSAYRDLWEAMFNYNLTSRKSRRRL